jgi:uncharacterized membrane protein YkvI
MTPSRIVQAFVIPAAVFQSVIVAGGYGTGREVVEFLSRFGPTGGLLATGTVALCFGIILSVTFEFARSFQAYDYRRFFKHLLGPGWIAYELLFAVALVLILAVVSSAAGTILRDSFDVPLMIGVAVTLGAVVVFNYFGRNLVEGSLTVWAVVLTTVLIAYCILVFMNEGATIRNNFSAGGIERGWLMSGLQFSLYNSAIVPVILYCARGIQERSEALVGGFLAGFMGAFPGLGCHVPFMAGYPEILDAEVPSYWLITRLGIPGLLVIFLIVLFVTIIQTGVGVLQGLNERLDTWFTETRGRSLDPWIHALVAGGVLAASLVLANVGIVNLVAKGYGTIAWGFMLVYSIPVLTVGVLKIRRRKRGYKPHD